MTRRRPPKDFSLVIGTITVTFLNGNTTLATCEGNNAAWNCACGKLLVGRCYYQFGDTCYTVCPTCNKHFRVKGDAKKRAIAVDEE